jgi:outer membrane protein assembly factor BamB
MRIVKLHYLALLALLAVVPDRALAAQAAKKEAAVAEWNQFRGPNRDGISTETGLLKEWPAGGPPQVWKATGIGKGYSSVCAWGTKLFTMGETDGKAYVVCLNAADGKILWKTEVGAGGSPGDQGEGPRGTPATDGTLVFALSLNGELVCVQAATGRLVWKKTMQQLGGGGTPGWGWSESPVLDGVALVVSPGGSGGVTALNKATGAPLWTAKTKGGAHYTSLGIADIGGIRQYLYFNDQTVTGIATRTGQIAWTTDRSGRTAIASTPVYAAGMVLVSSAYGVGHTGFRVAGAGGRFQVQKAYEGREMESHHGGLVAIGDHVYGPNENSVVCCDIKTGKVAWQDRSVGKGSVVAAEGHLYVRGEGGGMALIEATPTAYKEKGRFNAPKTSIPRGNAAWANPAIIAGKLYIRDWDSLYCYDIKAK